MEEKIKNLRKNLNEDDLLRQQAEFLKESKDPKFQPNYSKIYKSDQVNEKNKEQVDQQIYDEPSTNIFMPLNIVEHDTSNAKFVDIKKSDSKLIKIDESLLKCDLTKMKDTSNKKKSLFSQYMESKRQKMFESSSKSTESSYKLTESCSSRSKNAFASTKSALIDGSGLHEDSELAEKEIDLISKENDEKIRNLSKEEKDEMNQLISSLKPEMIEFLKSRKSSKLNKDKLDGIKIKKDYVSLNPQPVQKINESQVKFNRSKDEIPYISKEEIEQNKWLNMDKVEKEKLEWMRPLIENEKKISKVSSVEGKAARFNFDGDLVVEDKDYRLGLHHHSEQDASGYTINELINLIQSRYMPQRILALNTLANLFRRMHRGYFDVCFDKSLAIEIFEQTDIVIILRKLLDDPNLSLQLVTIKCIHSLVCNTIYDEFCLDRLFCSIELGIEVPKLCYEEIPNEKELKDEQLCKLDAISCLIRINLLVRLRYLLDSYMNRSNEIDAIVVDNIMDILIRISRHSNKSCVQIIETPFLIESLINNFISSTTSILNWKALKLIRILFTSNKDNITKIKMNHPKLWITFRNYLITNPLTEDNKFIYSTIIEVLRVWRVLLILDNEMNETTEQFIELTSNLRNCLRIKILVNNSFDLHYISNLLHCLAYVIQKKPELEHFFTPLVQNLTFQWFREIVNDNDLPKLDASLAVSSALLYLNWSSTPRDQLYEYILKPILDRPHLLNKLFDQLISKSSIINFKEYHNGVYRDSKALASYGSIYFDGSTIRLNSLLDEDSKIFLIGPLVGLAAKYHLNECLEQFIYNDKIKLYLDKVVKQVQKSSNWSIFELIEFNPISQLILWEQNVLNKNQYFNHSLSILSAVGDLQLKKSLLDYVFDAKKYKLLYDNRIDQSNQTKDQLIKSSISFFNESKKVFFKFCSFEEKDWIFEPLVRLYKLQLNEDSQLTEDEFANNLISCLNYLILIYNFKSDYLWTIVEPKILFVYLSSVFLFKNGLFLNAELVKILEFFLIDLLANYKIHFNCYEEKIPEPFCSIGDHFSALCSAFKEESYGNAVFSNYLLCFLTQSSDKIFRKKLFDEHCSCLNYFVLSKDQLLIELEHLINPIETDLTLIESYIRILMSKDILKQRNPLIYELVFTHISKSLFDDNYHENRLSNQELADKLIKCIKLSTNQQLKDDLNIH